MKRGKISKLSLVSLILVAALPKMASAACTLATGTYTCSGTQTTTETVSAAGLTYVLDNTFSSNVTTGGAFNLNSTNGINMTQSGTGTIAAGFGSTAAVSLTNKTAGTIVLDLKGNIIAGGTNTAINIGANAGTTGVSVTSTGNITGTSAAGIRIVSASSGIHKVISGPINVGGQILNLSAFTTSAGGNNVTINGDSSGRGIYSDSKGTGDNTLTINGNITNNLDNTGIAVINSSANAGNVLLDLNGSTNKNIQANNYSTTGTTTVDVAGSVGPTPVFGINATSVGGDIKVNVDGSITASTWGVAANNSGTGNINITTHNIINGSSNGIDAQIVNANSNGAITINSLGTINNTGWGIYTLNSGKGNTTITTSDTVTASGAGVVGLSNGAGAGNVTITTNKDVIAGSSVGVEGDILNASSTGNIVIKTLGNVSGTDNNGIYSLNLGTGDVEITTAVGTNVTGTGAFDAIYAGTNSGDITIKADSNVIGGANGITAASAGTGLTTIDVGATVTGGAGSGILAATPVNSTVIINLN